MMYVSVCMYVHVFLHWSQNICTSEKQTLCPIFSTDRPPFVSSQISYSINSLLQRLTPVTLRVMPQADSWAER